MLIITKENNSIKVVGQNNPTYPYSGTLIYPLNSVTVVTDQSNMAVFRSALNNDVLFTGLIDDITIDGSPVTKEDIGNKFGAISNSASTGGGGGGAVDSVNGHTGTVVLTASDVNAYSKEESDGKYATKAEIPSTDNLATKEELALKADKSSLGDYLLKSEAQSTYATKRELGAKLDVETYNSDKATFALKSELPDTSDFATTEQLNGKQDTLVSGTNIKTVNGNSLLGSGDITIEGGGTSYTAGEGIDISETNVISVDSAALNIPTLQTNKNGSTNNYVYSTGDTNSKKTNVIADIFFANDNLVDSLRCYVRYWGNDTRFDTFLTMPNANSKRAGAMSSLDKAKLDSIDVASILSRITALETQMGEVSAKLDNVNGETV